jgi:hypothetical protein
METSCSFRLTQPFFPNAYVYHTSHLQHTLPVKLSSALLETDFGLILMKWCLFEEIPEKFLLMDLSALVLNNLFHTHINLYSWCYKSDGLYRVAERKFTKWPDWPLPSEFPAFTTSGLKMEKARSPETMFFTNNFTWHLNSEERHQILCYDPRRHFMQ